MAKPNLRIIKSPPPQPEEARGPSLSFLKLTRNPALRSPVRFEPTKKGEGDVVI